MTVLTKSFEFRLKELRLELEIVSNVEDLVTDPEDDDQIPYWAELWPASQGLARYIWERVDFSGATVLEIGAGLGLPGLVAALKGGRVTMTDYKPEALEIIRKNAERNRISGVSLLLADWRRFPREHRYDWIIGSDVLYNPSLNGYVADILADCLAPGGHLLFAHPNRRVTLDFLREQRERLGFKEEREQVPVQVEDSLVPDQVIDIHHLYRS